jgi:hypothetical protein
MTIKMRRHLDATPNVLPRNSEQRNTQALQACEVNKSSFKHMLGMERIGVGAADTCK